MRDAQAEISHWDEFDYLVVNDDFDEALADLHAIIRHGQPKRRESRASSAEILADLLGTG